ncbi:MAG: hypothetical protein WA902_03940, partial [Thermosynechococcaceae cyanobacterium]
NKTDHIIKQVEVMEGQPRDKLLRLFEVAAQGDDRLEKAVRIWAVNDIRAATATARVDQRRLDYLQALFLQLGFSETEAKIRAQVAYTMRLGWFMMISKASERLAETHLVHRLLSQNSGASTSLES